MCVARHIGQRFGGDAESSNLDRRGQGRERIWGGNEHPQALRGLVLRSLVADSGYEPELVQCRRPQRIHEASEVSEREFDLLAQPTQQSTCRLRVSLN